MPVVMLAGIKAQVWIGLAETCQVLFLFYINRGVKMVPEQAICKSLCNGICVLPPEFNKISVVSFLNKNILAVIAAIVNVIILPKLKRNGIGHGLIIKYHADLTGLTRAIN